WLNQPDMKTRLIIFAFVPLVFAMLSHGAAAGKILTLQPADGATNVCSDTLLRLTFDAPPVLGSTGEIHITTTTGEPIDTIDMSQNDLRHAQPRMIGGMSFTNYPVLIAGNTATICPHLGALKYGQTCRISIDPGVFDGVTNKTIWTIHTRRSGPAADARRLI